MSLIDLPALVFDRLKGEPYIVLLGLRGAGKTCICLTFKHGHYVGASSATLAAELWSATYCNTPEGKARSQNDRYGRLDIIDTDDEPLPDAVDPDYPSIKTDQIFEALQSSLNGDESKWLGRSIRSAQGAGARNVAFLVCFSPFDRASFERAEWLLARISEFRQHFINANRPTVLLPTTLVATKLDEEQRKLSEKGEGGRVISRDQGMELAASMYAAYQEVSAKEDWNIEKTFSDIAARVYNDGSSCKVWGTAD